MSTFVVAVSLITPPEHELERMTAPGTWPKGPERLMLTAVIVIGYPTFWPGPKQSVFPPSIMLPASMTKSPETLRVRPVLVSIVMTPPFKRWSFSSKEKVPDFVSGPEIWHSSGLPGTNVPPKAAQSAASARAEPEPRRTPARIPNPRIQVMENDRRLLISNPLRSSSHETFRDCGEARGFTRIDLSRVLRPETTQSVRMDVFLYRLYWLFKPTTERRVY